MHAYPRFLHPCIALLTAALACGPEGSGGSDSDSATSETGASDPTTSAGTDGGETTGGPGGETTQGSGETTGGPGGETTGGPGGETTGGPGGETTGSSGETTSATTGAGADVVLLGAGYYYGECGGGCRGDMTRAEDALAHVVSDWDDTIHGSWTGNLTAEGVAELAVVEQALGTIAIEEIYGCPDGADGGGGYLVLLVDGEMMRTDYPLDGACGEPPPEILMANAVVAPIMDGFAECMATAAFMIDAPCEPVDVP